MCRVNLKRQLLQSNWESVEEGEGGCCGANPAISEKSCWAGEARQHIAVVDWVNYRKGKFTPWRAESNWAGGDLGARLREKPGKKHTRITIWRNNTQRRRHGVMQTLMANSESSFSPIRSTLRKIVFSMLQRKRHCAIDLREQRQTPRVAAEVSSGLTLPLAMELFSLEEGNRSPTGLILSFSHFLFVSLLFISWRTNGASDWK